MVDKIRFYCQKVLPLVYDDSLSYYEVLCKVSKTVNELITQVNAQSELINEIVEDFEGQVEEEVDKVLTEWIADGTWDELIKDALKKTYLLIADSYGVGSDMAGNTYIGWTTRVAEKITDIAEHVYILQGGGWGFTGKHGDTTASNTLKWLYNLENWVAANAAIVPSITDIVIVGGMNDHYTDSATVETYIAEFANYVKTTFPGARMHLGCAGWAGIGQIPLPSGNVPGGNVRSAMRGVVRAYSRASLVGMSYMGNLFECLHVYAANTVFAPDNYHPNNVGEEFLANAVINYIRGGIFNANSFGQNFTIAYNHGGRTGDFTLGVTYCLNDECVLINGEIGSALPMFTMSDIDKNTNTKIGTLTAGCIAGTPYTNMMLKLTAQNTTNQVLALLVIDPAGDCYLNPITDDISDGVVYSIEPLTATFCSLNC